MHRYLKLAVGSLLPVALLGGCSDWLSGPKLTSNPNNPVTAARDPLFVGVTVAQTTLQTGDLARLFSMWMQSMAGTDRQYIPLANYVFDQDSFSPDWSTVYTGGGLIDERSIQSQALSVGDSIYAGVAKVMEALTIGTAADVWGDIPYRQAADVSKYSQPEFDPQQQVYSDVQAQLDTAIAWMQCTSPSCQGPVNVDLWYGGDISKWIALAHTLKARYFLHVATQDPSAYASALAEAQQGISSPDGDLKTYQSNNPNEWNLWYQFIVIQRSGYIGSGAFLIDMLAGGPAPQLGPPNVDGSRPPAFVDPRIAMYYSTVDSIPKGTHDTLTFYQGAPPTGGSGNYSGLADARGGGTTGQGFSQPIVTYAENQLIIAEAEFQAANQPAAIAAYNAERESQGVPDWAGPGPITLKDIITEKYIADFQEIEVWNDWKRTCLPALTPAAPSGIPGRLLYPQSAEKGQNKNTPPDPTTARNWNQPNACPIP